MVAVIVTAMLVFARISALVTIMPVWSTTGVPKHVPVLGAFALMAIVAPNVPVVTEPASLGVLLCIKFEVSGGCICYEPCAMLFPQCAFATLFFESAYPTVPKAALHANLMYQHPVAQSVTQNQLLGVSCRRHMHQANKKI